MKADAIVSRLLEDDEVKAELDRIGGVCRVRVSFSKHRFHDDDSGDYDEENGWEDEHGVVMEPDESDLEEGLDAVYNTISYLREWDTVTPSSTRFHPGVYYIGETELDVRTGWYKECSYHLTGYTEEQEERVFNNIAGKLNDPRQS